MAEKCLEGLLAAAGVLLLLTALAAVFLRPDASPASAAPGEKLVWIELDRKRLTVYENGAVLRVFPIASGTAETPSPIGVFRVTSRFRTELSGFGTRFLGLNVPWGQYGIHGTNHPDSIGRNASHGCIRMQVKDAEQLYAMIPYGTRVVIEGGPCGPLNSELRLLKEGHRGADVRELQHRLILGGYLNGGADGVFGAATRQAVLRAQSALGFRATGQADDALQRKLGMLPFE